MKATTLLRISIFVLAGMPTIAAGQAPPAVVSVSTKSKAFFGPLEAQNALMPGIATLLEGLQQAVNDEKVRNAGSAENNGGGSKRSAWTCGNPMG